VHAYTMKHTVGVAVWRGLAVGQMEPRNLYFIDSYLRNLSSVKLRCYTVCYVNERTGGHELTIRTNSCGLSLIVVMCPKAVRTGRKSNVNGKMCWIYWLSCSHCSSFPLGLATVTGIGCLQPWHISSKAFGSLNMPSLLSE